jgi:RING-finger-containing ubiquitin ligase
LQRKCSGLWRSGQGANHRRQSILGNLGHTSTSSISSTIATSPDRQQQQQQQKKRTFNSVVSTMFSTWNGNDNDHGHDVRMDDLQQDGKDANAQQVVGGSIPVLDIPVDEAVVVAVSQEDAAEQGSRIETSCSSIPLQDETFVEDQQQIIRKDNDDDEEEDEQEEKVQDHLIRVLKLPCPGQQLVENHTVVTKCDNDGDDDEIPNNQGQDSTQTNFREIIPECCICLNDFKSGDVISWSPQHQCSHSFHEECIVKWFLTLCERSEARRARRMNGVGCNLQCPVCRQDFISLSETFPQSDVLHEEQV